MVVGHLVVVFYFCSTYGCVFPHLAEQVRAASLLLGLPDVL